MGKLTDWLEENGLVTKGTDEKQPQEKNSVGNDTVANNVTNPYKPTSEPAKDFAITAIQPDQLDPAYIKIIQKNLEEANLEGVDYFEFSQVVRASIAQGKSQLDAFKDAFTTLCVLDKGMTVAKIISASNYYLSKNEELKKNFEADCQGKVAEAEKTIGGQIDGLSKTAKALSDERSKITQRLTEIQIEEGRVNESKTTLENSLSKVKNEQAVRFGKMSFAVSETNKIIEADQKMIGQYLKTT